MRGRWHVCYGSGLSIIYNNDEMTVNGGDSEVDSDDSTSEEQRMLFS